MKRVLILLLLICFTLDTTFAAEFDASIDADIRKQYNVEELPALPKALPSKSPVKSSVNPPREIKTPNFTGKVYTIKSGTKITLVSKSEVAHWTSSGSKISFYSQNPITTKEGAVIPAGTLFKAVILDSHSPQITGNGGLIKLKISEIYYNNVMSSINTKISEANSKKIIKNKLKGKHKYWQNCSKAMTPGKKTFKIMQKAAKTLTPYPIINILSLVPFSIGGAVYLVNASIAPVASVFMKGGALRIPSGTVFIITVLGNNKING